MNYILYLGIRFVGHLRKLLLVQANALQCPFVILAFQQLSACFVVINLDLRIIGELFKLGPATLMILDDNFTLNNRRRTKQNREIDEKKGAHKRKRNRFQIFARIANVPSIQSFPSAVYAPPFLGLQH